MTSRKDIPAGGATGPGSKKPRPLGSVDPNSVRLRGLPKRAAVEEHAPQRQAMLGEPNAAAAAADVARAQGMAQVLALAQTQAAAQAAAAAPQSYAQRLLAAQTMVAQPPGMAAADLARKEAAQKKQEMDRAMKEMEQEDLEVGDAGKSGTPVVSAHNTHTHSGIPKTVQGDLYQ